MKILRRLLPVVVLSTLLAACGGSDPGDLSADTSEARGGKKGTGSGGGTTTTPSGAYVTAPNSTYNGYTTVSLYPAGWMSSQLWLSVKCSQNGAVVYDASNSYELHYSVQYSIPGTTLVGDHFEKVYGPFRSSLYTGGAASCAITAYARDSSGAYFTIATGAFSLL